MVVGADGLHSNVRRLVFGPERSYEHYLGCKVAAWVVEGYRPRDDLSYVTYNTSGRQVGRFALHGHRTMFVCIFRAPRCGVDEAPKGQLHNAFGGAGWECPEILATLDDVDDLYFDVVSQIRMEGWSRDRVLLIGDAAGCISLLGGEGTGLASPGLMYWPGNWRGLAATTTAPSAPTSSGCARSSRRSKPPRRDTSGSSPPGPSSGCGFATWRCAR